MTLALPSHAAVDEIDPLPDGVVLYEVSTFLEPSCFMRRTAGSARATRTALAVTSPISFADTAVTGIFATSKGGIRVPISIIGRKGIAHDGGYAISMTPEFAGSRVRLWLDAGGVYAVVNLCGGGECGQRWHKQGMLTRKQNVFDDFAAAGAALIAQHPELARPVIGSVGIYDMLRVENDPNGAFNVSKFGSVKDPAQFEALYAYPPYDRVKAGIRSPAVLMLTDANDGRVNAMHSRKFATAQQEATTSDRPILLRRSKNCGHGICSSLDERIAQPTDMLMFLFDQLDMSAAAAAR